MKNNSLQKDFELRKEFFTNRASAIFPIYFSSNKNDLILSWLNYWVIKNDNNHSSLAVNIRIYDSTGTLIIRTKVDLEKYNNMLSVKSILEKETFEGMVEIEIISVENIKFTFPAIIGFYKTGSLYSCVHSAGRIKGSDESYSESVTEETNWSCKFSSTITPFFHYIHGNIESEAKLRVNLKSEDGVTIESVDVCERFNAFSSKIYFIDDLMPNGIAKEGMFISVETVNSNVFRRMVVGNYHKNLKHMEVTHSFPKQISKDHCPINEDGAESFLALYSDSNLSLRAKVFPTNCEGSFLVKESNQYYKEKKLDSEKDTFFLKNGYGEVELENEARAKVLWLYGDSVPSRLNCNFIYRVKDSNSVFSTDIATGAKSSVYPPKHSHWGSGVFGNGYDFALMVRNANHNRNSSMTNGKLIVYGDDFKFEQSVEIEADSSSSFLLSSLIKGDLKKNLAYKETIFTWFLKLDQPYSETFWVSFRKEDGCVVGDHGF